jgi:hypothetical protein
MIKSACYYGLTVAFTEQKLLYMKEEEIRKMKREFKFTIHT